MFTGLVTDIGEVVGVAPKDAGVRLTIASGFDATSLDIGASIACSGPCLTVVACIANGEGGCRFDVDVSSETVARTTLGSWVPGTRVNLERSLRAGDELGGHFVSGHIDATAAITGRRDERDAAHFSVRAPDHLMRFVATKGSVCLDGVSLTINGVDGVGFGVTIIPHTLRATTLGALSVGDRVNLEVDLIARYLDRLREAG